MTGKKKLAYRLSIGFLSLIQLIGIIGIGVFNYLSRKRVGINHHVIIMKKEYMKTLLRPEAIEIYRICVIVLMVLALIYLIRCIIKKKDRKIIVSGGLVLFLLVLVYIELVSAILIALPIYAYLLLITVVILGIELLKLVLKILFLRKQ